jgi:CrcB protein
MDSAGSASRDKPLRFLASADDSCQFNLGVIMLIYLYVALGGALGTVGRYALGDLVVRFSGIPAETFPWGTLLINITGSFIIGFFATLTLPPDGRWVVGTDGRQFFMTGICGGYTTFSAFSLQTLNLARDGEWLRVGGYITGSVTLSLLAVWLGYVLATAINLKKGS